MKKLFCISIVILLTACASPPPTLPKADQLATVVAQTLTAQPVVFTPIPTFTPAATATPTIGVSSVIYTSAQNVNLRTQPGTLFPVSRVMAQGTRLNLLGMAPGGGWAYVVTDEGVVGWVDINFVDEFNAGGLSVIEPRDSQVVKGYVLDASGNPISGIGFAFTQGGKRTDAESAADGTFRFYLPLTASGKWTASYVSIAAASNVMTTDCAGGGQCGEVTPPSIEIALPANEVLSFVWE